MARKRHIAEDVISKLREAEMGLAKGMAVPEVCRRLGITEQAYYRWRKEYGGLSRVQGDPPLNSPTLSYDSPGGSSHNCWPLA